MDFFFIQTIYNISLIHESICPNKSLVRNVKPMVFPIAWNDDEIEVTDENLNKLKSGKMLAKIAYILPLLFFSMGCLVVVLTSAFLIYQILKIRKTHRSNSLKF